MGDFIFSLKSKIELKKFGLKFDFKLKFKT